jgi:hypothetical protein
MMGPSVFSPCGKLAAGWWLAAVVHARWHCWEGFRYSYSQGRMHCWEGFSIQLPKGHARGGSFSS